MRQAFVKSFFGEPSLVSCTCTKTLLRMQRHRVAAIAFFGGWFTLTLATFVFLVPALPPLKPTLADLIGSPNRGSEVPFRRVRPWIPAKEKGTEVEAEENYRFSNHKGPTFDDQPPRHNDAEKQPSESTRLNMPSGSLKQRAADLSMNVLNPRSVQVISLDNPRAFLYKGFMSDEECDFLVDHSKPNMFKSGVVDAENGGSAFSDIRTSTGSFVPKGLNVLIQNIERRIARWSQLPESHGEPMQVLRYKPGEEYRAHYDYFFHDGGKLNNRIATVLMYLSDVEVRVNFPTSLYLVCFLTCFLPKLLTNCTKITICTQRNKLLNTQAGGETVFPNTDIPNGRNASAFSVCGNNGKAVKPKKGDALLFWSMKVGGELDGGSSHAGCPVESGEKWTATKWIHVAPLSSREAHQRVFFEGREVSTGKCADAHETCHTWAVQDECRKNPGYMLDTCPLSCTVCNGQWREGSYTH
jgi:prolyl 4-hydroxylase